MAPEVIEGKHDKSCDLWSVGVVAFVLLSGRLPFDGQTEEDTFTKIKYLNYHFEDECWNTISDDGKDFIESLLQKDPNDRLSAEKALKHSWFETTEILMSASSI